MLIRNGRIVHSGCLTISPTQLGYSPKHKWETTTVSHSDKDKNTLATNHSMACSSYTSISWSRDNIYIYIHMGGSVNGVHKNGWFIMEDPSINVWFGGIPISGNHQIYIYIYVYTHSQGLISMLDDAQLLPDGNYTARSDLWFLLIPKTCFFETQNIPKFCSSILFLTTTIVCWNVNKPWRSAANASHCPRCRCLCASLDGFRSPEVHASRRYCRRFLKTWGQPDGLTPAARPLGARRWAVEFGLEKCGKPKTKTKWDKMIIHWSFYTSHWKWLGVSY